MSTKLKALLLAAARALRSRPGLPSPTTGSQLAASAGLDPSQVEELTLTEIAAYKFSRDSIGQKAGVEPGSNGAREHLAASAGLSADEADGDDPDRDRGVSLQPRIVGRGAADDPQRRPRHDGEPERRRQPAGP